MTRLLLSVSHICCFTARDSIRAGVGVEDFRSLFFFLYNRLLVLYHFAFLFYFFQLTWMFEHHVLLSTSSSIRLFVQNG